MVSEEYATARDAMVGIAAECDNVLAFLQAVAIKAQQVLEAPLSMQADKCTRNWFHKWEDRHVTQHPTHHKSALQDQYGLTRFLGEVATRLQNAEALRPVIADQHEADRETRGWNRPPLTAQRVILAAISVNRLTILLETPPSLHIFLNAGNVTSLQANCTLP